MSSCPSANSGLVVHFPHIYLAYLSPWILALLTGVTGKPSCCPRLGPYRLPSWSDAHMAFGCWTSPVWINDCIWTFSSIKAFVICFLLIGCCRCLHGFGIGWRYCWLAASSGLEEVMLKHNWPMLLNTSTAGRETVTKLQTWQVWSWTFNLSCISLLLSGKNKHAAWQNSTWRRLSKCNRSLSWLDYSPVVFNMQCYGCKAATQSRFLEAEEPFSCVLVFLAFKQSSWRQSLWHSCCCSMAEICGESWAGWWQLCILLDFCIWSSFWLATSWPVLILLRYQTTKWLSCWSGSLKMFTRTSMAFLAEGGFQGREALELAQCCHNMTDSCWDSIGAVANHGPVMQFVWYWFC